MTARIPALLPSASQTLAHCHQDRSPGALHLFLHPKMLQTPTHPSGGDDGDDMVFSAKEAQYRRNSGWSERLRPGLVYLPDTEQVAR